METDKDRKIAVIGAGASGLVAAYYASANPMNTVVIFEKNDEYKVMSIIENGKIIKSKKYHGFNHSRTRSKKCS